jgi:hypothetical protein
MESVLRAHLVALAGRTELLAGLNQQAFIDIDSGVADCGAAGTSR